MFFSILLFSMQGLCLFDFLQDEENVIFFISHSISKYWEPGEKPCTFLGIVKMFTFLPYNNWMFLSLNSNSNPLTGRSSHLACIAWEVDVTAPAPGLGTAQGSQEGHFWNTRGCAQGELKHRRSGDRRSWWPPPGLLLCGQGSQDPFRKRQQFPQQLWGHLVQRFWPMSSGLCFDPPDLHHHTPIHSLSPHAQASNSILNSWWRYTFSLIWVDPGENVVEGDILRIYTVEMKP